MRELDKTKVYSLEDLTSDELTELINYLEKNYSNWENFVKIYDGYTLYFSKEDKAWYQGDKKPTANAKELFYTLENIQVDCRYLTDEQIDEIADVFKKDGYRIGSLFLMEEYCFIRQNAGKYCLITTKHKNKTKITYEKFMELFGKEEESFKKLVEVLNEELTEEAYKETEYEVKYIAEKPKQYQIGIDTFQRCEANMTKEDILACCKFNIDKYNWRNKGQDLEDLEKIISYANWGIKQLKQNDYDINR